MKITYRVEDSMTALAADIGISFARLRDRLREGMGWYTHFWDHTIEENPKKGRFRFRVTKPRNAKQIHAWAWQSGNTLNFNRAPLSPTTGKVGIWTETGLVFGAAHESGHALITSPHIANAPYYGDTSFGHVLSITSYWYQGTFSPLEVWYGVTKKRWKIRANARHPYVDIWLKMSKAEQARNKELVLKICTPYAQLGLYRPVGHTELDGLMGAVTRAPNPKIVFKG